MSLYVELALLVIVLSVGGTLMSVANSVSTSIKLEEPPRASAYLIYNKTVVVSWDSRVLEVDLVCPSMSAIERLRIQRGVTIVEAVCEDLVVVYSSYVIRPVRVVR